MEGSNDQTQPGGSSSRSSDNDQTQPVGSSSSSSDNDQTQPGGSSSKSSNNDKTQPVGSSSRSSDNDQTQPVVSSRKSSDNDHTQPVLSSQVDYGIDQESTSDSDTQSDATIGPDGNFTHRQQLESPMETTEYSSGPNYNESITTDTINGISMRRKWTTGDGNMKVRVDTPNMGSEHREGRAGSVRQLKDLLSRISPMISSADSVDNTPQMLMFLSDTDPKFHTLQLVKAMRSEARNQLESTIEKLVRQHLDVTEDTIRDENPVASVLNNLFQDKTFLKYMEYFQNNLMDSSDYLHRNFESEMASLLLEFYLSNTLPSDNYGMESSSNNSSLNSSLNQSGFLFLTPGQYESIASTLLNKQLTGKWCESLNQLLSVTPGEPVLQDCWFDMKKGLQNSLQLPTTKHDVQAHEIFNKSLQMHSKLLASQTQTAVTEAFVNLIDAASEFWYSKKLISIVPKKDEDFDTNDNYPMFRIIKLVLLFQKDVPLLWVRYPQHLTIRLIEKWLDFLVEQNGRVEHMSSNDIVCLLDPGASWLRHWLHTHFSRIHVFAALARNPALLTHAVRICYHVLTSAQPMLLQDSQQNHKLSKSQVKYFKFQYCLNFVLETIRYHEGRQLFPITIAANGQTLTVERMLHILYNIKNHQNATNVSQIVYEKLRDLGSQNDQAANLICHSGLPQKYVTDLLNDRHKMDKNHVSLFLACLQSLMSTDRGLKYMLLGSADNGAGFLHASSECSQMLDLFGRLLVEEHQLSRNYSVTFDMTTTVLATCVGRHLYAGHKTFQQTLTNLTHLYHETSVNDLHLFNVLTNKFHIAVTLPLSINKKTSVLIKMNIC